MEMRDIYNIHKERTGKVNEKGSPLLEGEYILVNGCWIVNHNREIFLTKRSPNKKFMPNKWENTGGHVMAGEDGKTATIREVFEETGIRSTPEEMILWNEYLMGTTFCEEYILVKDFSTEEVVLQEGETCDCMWVSEEKWEEMLASGEIAPSIGEKMKTLKPKFLEILHSI